MLLRGKFAIFRVAVCLIALWTAACPAPAEEKDRDKKLIEELGNPLAQRYPDGTKFHFARAISALQIFDGKLYLGHGDWGENSGPTDIWCYDLHKKEFVKQGQIEDEAAEHFRIINGKLYVPGMDPQEDWRFGNFYRLEGGKWVKHRTLPNAVHNFDMVGVGRSLFALTTDDKIRAGLLESTDDGKSWKTHEIPAEIKIHPDTYLQQRLLVIDGNVYVSGTAPSGEVKVLRFSGKGLDPCTGEMLPGAEKPVPRGKGEGWERLALEKPAAFKGKAVYLGGLHQSIKEADKPWRRDRSLALFVATLAGPTEFRATRSLADDNLTDFVVDDERCYALGYCWKVKDDPKQGAVTTVYASADLKTWSKLFSFQHETFASALAVVDGDFYLGLGGIREHCTSSMGKILKVGKDKLK
jgi:hypothetical protein